MNAIQTAAKDLPRNNDPATARSAARELSPVPDLFTTLVEIMVEAEDAGNWDLIRSMLHREGRWMVDQSISRKDVVRLRYLTGLRDRLRAAMEYERIHGERSLRKLDHPQNLLLADTERRCQANNPRFRDIKFPCNEALMMADWETYDFTTAMSRINGEG